MQSFHKQTMRAPFQPGFGGGSACSRVVLIVMIMFPAMQTTDALGFMNMEVNSPVASGRPGLLATGDKAKVVNFLPKLHPQDLTIRVNLSVIGGIMVVLAIVLVGGLAYFALPKSDDSAAISKCTKSVEEPMDSWSFVGSSPLHVSGICDKGKSDVVLPSGIWRGYSKEEGKDFEVVEFVLDFTAAGIVGGMHQPGQVTGNGTDDTGKYSLAGVYEQRRLGFQKKYIWGTPALDGRIKHESNSGHVVEYRAEWAGDNLRKGIMGQWFVEELSGSERSNGKFHIWPAMDGWQRIGQNASVTASAPLPSKATQGSDALLERRITAFKVDEDHICAKCYENPIDVCLLPCGHTAICRACESRLRHRLCPICYAPVNMIVTENGAVLKCSQNSAQRAPRTA